MADVFLSYARGDRTVAERLADALERAGTEVWFDRRISGGTTFSDVIEAELEAARKVVVLWSAESVRSGWVRDEATAANEMGKLLPVLIDGTQPPMGFRQIQTVDLQDWARSEGAPLPLDLVEALGMASPPVATGGGQAVERPGAAPSSGGVLRRPAVLAAGVLVLLGAGGAAFLGMGRGWLGDQDDAVHVTVEPLDARAGDSPAQALSKGLAADLARVSLDASTSLTVSDASESSGDADIRLTGSAETSGGVLHASIRVLGREGDGILWSKSFERPVGEAGALREEIAAQTADVLICAQTGGADKLKLPARRLFLAACDLGNQDMAAGLANYRRVLEIEPEFLPARLRAAAAENAIGGNMGGPEGARMRAHALSEARSILRDDPSQVRANAIIASNLRGFENWSERMRLSQEATRSHGTGPSANVGYEYIIVGRVGEGIPWVERSVAEAPFGTVGAANLAELYGFSDRLPDAIALLERMQVRNPDSLYVGTSRFEIAARVGDPDQALRLLDRSYIGEYYSPARLALWRALIQARKSPAAVQAARAAALAVDKPGADQLILADAMQDLVQIGDLDGAYRLGSRLVPGDSYINDVWWRSYMAPFRADPRFPAFIERWGQPMVWRATGKLPDYCTDETPAYDCRKAFLKKT